MLTISSTPAGRDTSHEFEGAATVESLELYCFGDEAMLIEVDFGIAAELGTIEQPMECAEGIHELSLDEASVDHTAVDGIEVRSSPSSDDRHYVVALGALN